MTANLLSGAQRSAWRFKALCLIALTPTCQSGAQTSGPTPTPPAVPTAAAGATSGERAARQVPDGEPALFRADLERDARLAVPVTLSAPSITLEQCLSRLAKNSGVRLTVAAPIKTRRVSAFVAGLQMRDLMTALARVHGFSWRRPAPATPPPVASANAASPAVPAPVPADYELYQSNQARLVEQAAIKNSEVWEQRELKAKSDAVMAAINANLGARSKDTPSFADMLADFSPEQLQRLAGRAAPDDVAVIAADNNAYMHDHLLFARPFASLPPQTQQSLRAQLAQPRPTSGGKLPDYPDMGNLQVGIVAMNGDVRLGIVNADGKDLNTTHLHVQRKGLPGIDGSNSSSAEINQAMDADMVSLDGLPPAKRAKRLRSAKELQRFLLPVVLADIARQTGISIVSDDYLSSRFMSYSWLLTDRDDYAPTEALDQVARAFAHRMRYSEGVLRVSTVSPGLDLRGEPPDEAVARMTEIAVKKLPMELDDYVMLAGLTRLQCSQMPAATRYGETQRAVSTNMQRLYPILHFYGLLSLTQRSQAEQTGGLAMADIRGGAHQALASLLDRGLPALLPATQTPARPGFYVHRTRSGGRDAQVVLMLVSDSAARNVSIYRLPLTQDQPTPQRGVP